MNRQQEILNRDAHWSQAREKVFKIMERTHKYRYYCYDASGRQIFVLLTDCEKEEALKRARERNDSIVAVEKDMFYNIK